MAEAQLKMLLQSKKKKKDSVKKEKARRKRDTSSRKNGHKLTHSLLPPVPVNLDESSSDEDRPEIVRVDKEHPGLVTLADGSEEWIVQRILDKKLVDNVINYKVKWFGWPNRYNSWEPINHLQHCHNEIRAYEKRLEERIKKGHVKLPQAEKQKTTSSPAAAVDDMNFDLNRVKAEPLSEAEDEVDGQESRQEEEDDDIFVMEPEVTDATILAEELPEEEEVEDVYRAEKIVKMNDWAEWYDNLRMVTWRHNEEPVGILGSLRTKYGKLVHLVRIKSENDPINVRENAYENLSKDNLVIAADYVIKKAYPKLLAKYYLDCKHVWVENSKKEEEVATAAAKHALVHNYFKGKVELNYEAMYNTLLPEGIVTLPKSFKADRTQPSPFVGAENHKKVDPPKLDPFGLPVNISGEEEPLFLSDSDSSDDDDDDEVSDEEHARNLEILNKHIQ